MIEQPLVEAQLSLVFILRHEEGPQPTLPDFDTHRLASAQHRQSVRLTLPALVRCSPFPLAV